MTIAITGATGKLGRLVIQKLTEHVNPADIVGLVRSPSKAADLGIPVRRADYMEPPTLEAALQGVNTLLLISGNEIGHRTVQHANVIAAAKKAGVQRIVYTSLLHADTSPLSLAPEHVQTETDLKHSGVAYTILRNGWYTENYTAAIPPALANGALYGSTKDGKISSAPRADYAEAAVKALTGTGHENQVYELAGDEPYTLAELAAEVSKQTGKDIPYRDVPEENYAAALKEAGLPDELAEAIASWDVGVSHGALYDNGKQLSRLIGRPTGSLHDAVATALKT